jgi:hypothetical protein
MNIYSVNGNGTVEHTWLPGTPSEQSETQMYLDESASQPALVLAQVYQEKIHVRK